VDIYAHLPPLNFRAAPMTPSKWKYGREVLAAVLLVEVWEDRGSAIYEEPPPGFQHGRPWAPEPDGWIL